MEQVVVDGNVLKDVLGKIELGEPVKAGALWFVPVVNSDSTADADLLEEGIASGQTEVAEVSQNGIVGEIMVAHCGKRKLLIIDGEQVIGAKQDRVFNASFLIDPGTTVHIPVSCVERGRWHARGSHKFSSGRTTSSSRMRARKLTDVVSTLRSHGTYEGSQQNVWHSVDMHLDACGVASQTSAFSDAFRSRALEIDRQIDTLKPVDGQVGVMVLQGKKFVSMDLFGSPALYSRGYIKVLRGALSEIFVQEDEKPSSKSNPRTTARSVLKKLAVLEIAANKAPGSGETISGKDGKLVLSSICDGGNVYHVFAAAVA
jgi:hypothetical protein